MTLNCQIFLQMKSLQITLNCKHINSLLINLMTFIYQQEYLARPFEEFKQLSDKGKINEANLYITTVLRELEDLHKAKCAFAITLELHKINQLIVDEIFNLIHVSLKDLIAISDLLAIECEIVFLDVVADCIKKCCDLDEITHQLSAVRELRMKQLQSDNKDSFDNSENWNTFVLKAKSWHRLRLH